MVPRFRDKRRDRMRLRIINIRNYGEMAPRFRDKRRGQMRLSVINKINLQRIMEKWSRGFGINAVVKCG